MYTSYLLRIRPNKTQVLAFEHILATNCDLHNAALQERRDAWRMCGKSIDQRSIFLMIASHVEKKLFSGFFPLSAAMATSALRGPFWLNEDMRSLSMSFSLSASRRALIPRWKSIAISACSFFTTRCLRIFTRKASASFEYILKRQTPFLTDVSAVNDSVPPKVAANCSSTGLFVFAMDAQRKYCHPDFNLRPRETYTLPSPSKNPAAYAVFMPLVYHCSALYESAGKWAVPVNPRGTSQKCSGCGEMVPKALGERWHSCPNCGTSLDRDHNAAINILRLGESLVESSTERANA